MKFIRSVFPIFCMIVMTFSQTMGADQVNYLKITKPKISGIENSKFYSEQTLKLAQKAMWLHGKYSPLISDKKTTLNIAILDLEISKIGNLASINFSIYTNEGNIISKAWATGIEERFILLQVRLTLYELFYGKQQIKEVLNKIQKKELEKNKAENQKENTANNEDLNEVERDIYTLIKSAGVNVSLTMKPFSTSSSLTDSIEFEDATLMLQESLDAQKKKSKRADEFKVNLSALRLSINIALKNNQESKEEKKKKEKVIKEEEEKKSLDEEISAKNSAKAPEELFNAKFDKDMRDRNIRHIIDYVYMNKNSETDYLINTKNNFNFTGLRYTYRKNVYDNRGDDYVFSLHYLKSIGSKEEKYNVPAIINGYLQYLFAPKWLPFDLFGGIHFENQPFINLEKYNEGLKSGENQILWYQVGFERVFEVKKKKVILNYSYFKTLFAMNSYDIKNLSGTKQFIEAKMDFYDNYRIGIGGFKEEICGKDFEITQNSFLISLAFIAKTD